MSASTDRTSGMPSRPYTTSGAPLALSLRTRQPAAAPGTSKGSPFKLYARSDIVFETSYIYTVQKTGSRFHHGYDFRDYFISARYHINDQWQRSEDCQRVGLAFTLGDLAET